jgi:hypothetical protein
MGRTIPSFRLASVGEEGDWKIFRNAIDKSDRKVFDEMFSASWDIPLQRIKKKMIKWYTMHL